MSHSITVRLNKAATEFDAGESVGFGLRAGVKFFDRLTKSEQYTNYEATIFIKKSNAAQVEYHRKMFVEGAIVEISGQQQAIRQFQGANGLSISIELLDARVGFLGIGAPKAQQNQAAQNQQQAQQSYNQPAQNQQPVYNQAPQQSYNQASQNQQSYNQAPQQPIYNQHPQQNYHPNGK